VKYGLNCHSRLFLNASRMRGQLTFEVSEATLQLIDALFESEYVIAGWVVYAFQHFEDMRNFGP
jgi:hypothetical protein